MHVRKVHVCHPLIESLKVEKAQFAALQVRSGNKIAARSVPGLLKHSMSREEVDVTLLFRASFQRVLDTVAPLSAP